jgi:hypothetical protein
MIYFELRFRFVKVEKMSVFVKVKSPKMLDFQEILKNQYFFRLFFENKNSVPLTLLSF